MAFIVTYFSSVISIVSFWTDMPEHGTLGAILSDSKGAPIPQLGGCQSLDRKVAGSILNCGTVLCP